MSSRTPSSTPTGRPVLAGIHLPDTPAVIERARIARELGADTAVVTTPFRSEISQEEIYRQLREAADIPLFEGRENLLTKPPASPG